MSIATLRERIVAEMRVCHEPAYTYPALRAWGVDSSLADSKTLAEVMARAIFPEITDTDPNDWRESILDFYPSGAGLPPSPEPGDRYIARQSGNGWTINCIYEWDGSTWVEFIPDEGCTTWNEYVNGHYTFYGGDWHPTPPGHHHHSAADITSGTLEPARGGTGISSYTTGSYIRANSEDVLEQLTAAEVLADIGAAAAAHRHYQLYDSALTDVRVDVGSAACGFYMGGDTIPAWDSGYSAIHLAAQEFSLYAKSTSDVIGFANNCTFKDGVWKRVITDHAGRLDFDASAGLVITHYITGSAGSELATSEKRGTFAYYVNNSQLWLANQIQHDDGDGDTAEEVELFMQGLFFDDSDNSNTSQGIYLHVLPISKTAYKLQILDYSRSEIANIDESGKAAFLSQTIIGSVTVSPSSELDVYQSGCPTNPYFQLRHEWVDHGMTAYVSSDGFFGVDISSTSYGGAKLVGASESTFYAPLGIYGISGSYCSGQPYIEFIAGKKSGTGITNIGDTEIGFDFRDYSQSLLKIYGDGKAQFTGEVVANGNSKVIASSTTPQEIANNTYVTAIFDIETVDTLGEYNSSTGVFTASKAGTYVVSWYVQSASVAWDVGEIWTSILSKNDSSDEGSAWGASVDTAFTAATRYMRSQGSAIVQLAANDTLRVKCIHNQGAAIYTIGNELGTFFHIARTP